MNNIDFILYSILSLIALEPIIFWIRLYFKLKPRPLVITPAMMIQVSIFMVSVIFACLSLVLSEDTDRILTRIAGIFILTSLVSHWWWRIVRDR